MTTQHLDLHSAKRNGSQAPSGFPSDAKDEIEDEFPIRPDLTMLPDEVTFAQPAAANGTNPGGI